MVSGRLIDNSSVLISSEADLAVGSDMAAQLQESTCMWLGAFVHVLYDNNLYDILYKMQLSYCS